MQDVLGIVLAITDILIKYLNLCKQRKETQNSDGGGESTQSLIQMEDLGQGN